MILVLRLRWVWRKWVSKLAWKGLQFTPFLWSLLCGRLRHVATGSRHNGGQSQESSWILTRWGVKLSSLQDPHDSLQASSRIQGRGWVNKFNTNQHPQHPECTHNLQRDIIWFVWLWIGWGKYLIWEHKSNISVVKAWQSRESVIEPNSQQKYEIHPSSPQPHVLLITQGTHSDKAWCF